MDTGFCSYGKPETLAAAHMDLHHSRKVAGLKAAGKATWSTYWLGACRMGLQRTTSCEKLLLAHLFSGCSKKKLFTGGGALETQAVSKSSNIQQACHTLEFLD